MRGDRRSPTKSLVEAVDTLDAAVSPEGSGLVILGGMAEDPVDVSDAARPKRSISWRSPSLVVSESDSGLTALFGAEIWPELWFTRDEIELSKKEARLEQVQLRAGVHTRTCEFERSAQTK